MLEDARRLSRREEIAADVCIVGAGAAGLALARELARSHLRVALIESGGLQSDPLTESLNQDPAGDVDYPTAASRARYFGGATNLWSGVCLPLDEIEFEPRAWLPYSGWPFRRDSLLPFYDRASAALCLSPITLTDLSEYRRVSGRVPRTIESEEVDTVVMQFCKDWRLAGTWGQEVGRSTNVTTWLHANAIGLETDPDGNRVERLRLACLGGEQLTVAARAFVLATGAIENARLLLASDGIREKGIGNEHDLVGRFFAEHYALTPGYAEAIEPAMSFDFYTQPARHDEHWICGALILREEVRRARQLSGMKLRFYSYIDAEHYPSVRALRRVLAAARERRVADAIEASLPMLADPIRVGGFLTWRMLRRYGIDIATHRTVYPELEIEQAPDPENRVLLSEERDALGQRRATVRTQLRDADWEFGRRATAMVEQAMARCGASGFHSLEGVELLYPPRYVHHQVGTTRMHDRPEQGVVDRDCKVHGVANLYVAGSSVFPTAGAANPTLTIIALAVRLADHLRTTF